MTQREKILLGSIAGAAAAYGAFVGLQRSIVEPFADLATQKQASFERRNQLKQSLGAAQQARADWVERTGVMFSTAPAVLSRTNEARQRFLDDIANLLTNHDLRDGQQLSPGPATPMAKNGFSEIPLTVNVTGTMGGLVGFLRDFYQRPYPARIRTLRISPADPVAARGLASATAKHGNNLKPRGKNRGAAGGTAEGDSDAPPERIKIQMSLVTLVAQPIPGIKSSELPADISTAKRVKVAGDSRLARTSADDYPKVAMLDWFRKTPPPRPPPPPPPPPPGPEVKVATAPPPPPPPPPVDKRKDADKLFVIGTIAFEGDQVAYVRDDRSPGAAIQHLHPGELIDDGKVVLVHPRGIVVRVEEKSPDGVQTLRWVDYFYEIGKDFKGRVPLETAGLADIVMRGV